MELMIWLGLGSEPFNSFPELASTDPQHDKWRQGAAQREMGTTGVSSLNEKHRLNVGANGFSLSCFAPITFICPCASFGLVVLSS